MHLSSDMWRKAVRALAAALLGVLVSQAGGAAAASAEAGARMKIVALGDSLTAGYGLAPADSFPAQLERALAARGHAVEILNAGVSGETVADGLARLDWAVPRDAQAVIVELGANDMLLALPPARTRAALDSLVASLVARRKAVLLTGMLAPANLGEGYVAAFNGMFPDLASKHGVLLDPFFLDGVAGNPALNQPDGLHPTAAGVATIVARILPKVEELIARAKAP